MERAQQGALQVARAVAIVIPLASGHALANGRYPTSSLVAFDPAGPSHFAISTTFGLLESRDGGKTFLWRCEPAIGVADQQDLTVAITASGALVTTRADGVAVTSDGCSFANPPELAKKTIGDLTLYRSQPHALAAFSNDSRLDGGFDSQVFRSEDDGLTWAAVGAALPQDFLPLTIDTAPSDVSHLYLSGRVGGDRQFSSVLLRSNDGGVTFVSSDIPETAESRTAYIAAVHPFDPERVYLRAFSPNGTILWATDDGGATYRKIFTGTDQLLGFALSPDGTEMAFGGPGDGIWVGAADGTGLTRRSDVRPTCLGWTADGLLACADVMVDGFSVGRSRDDAATFETLLRFDALCGQTGCSPDSRSAMSCVDAWSVVGPTLGAVCGIDAGTVDAGTVEARTVDTGAVDAGSSTDGRRDAEAEANAPVAGPLTVTAGGGGCSLAAPRPGGGAMGLLVLSGFLARRRRSGLPKRLP